MTVRSHQPRETTVLRTAPYSSRSPHPPKGGKVQSEISDPEGRITARPGSEEPGTQRPALLAGEERDVPDRYIFRGID